ncbi:unnamed protein product [Callosobruchus maculatus]|uniref:Zasp-like motif domain-containing protein n=1 Tax=Callosobruchus maculatus TaxID=64391 RepID=A0A653BRE0_CALMS|nr:unnamed protein product [Callosobruchus maculatus]
MKMNNTSIFSMCLLVLISTAAAQNGARKTTLEDIERDYTTTSKPKQTTAKVVSPVQSPTLYGFVPIKTIADYARNEPKPLLYSQGRQQYSPYAKQQYHQQGQHHRGSSAGTKAGTTQAYTFPLQFDLPYSPPHQHLQTVTDYYHEKQYPSTQQDSAPKKYTAPRHQYDMPHDNSYQENAYTFPLQFDLPYSPPQQHSQTGTQYYHQQQYSTTQQNPATQQYTTPRQQYSVPQEGSYKNVQYETDNNLAAQQYPKNVQYVTDNSIGNQQQQYYSPQYVYLQQDPAPSTSVQTFVDPKGGVQYIMLIPQSAITTTSEQPQKYENLAYATTDGEADNQKYSQISYSNEKEQEVPAVQQYVYQYEQKEGKAPAAGVQYVVHPQYEQKEQQQVQYVPPKPQYTKPSEYIIKREPKSLLDSYIPSVVQLEYYRQIQQNAIRDNAKVPQVFHKRQEFASQTSTTEDTTPDVSRQYFTKYVPQSNTKRYSYRG